MLLHNTKQIKLGLFVYNVLLCMFVKFNIIVRFYYNRIKFFIITNVIRFLVKRNKTRIYQIIQFLGLIS